jgi:hypothetical protein
MTTTAAAPRYFVREDEITGYHPANHVGTLNKRLIGPETVGAKQLELLHGTHPAREGRATARAPRHRAGGATCSKAPPLPRWTGQRKELHPGDCCFFPADAMHVFTVSRRARCQDHRGLFTALRGVVGPRLSPWPEQAIPADNKKMQETRSRTTHREIGQCAELPPFHGHGCVRTGTRGRHDVFAQDADTYPSKLRSGSWCRSPPAAAPMRWRASPRSMLGEAVGQPVHRRQPRGRQWRRSPPSSWPRPRPTATRCS